ncbi:hypothetical protein C8N46_104156 [Kordia periserrulae]|uniref:Uncharacterized protein n=1 Tax=Kordia periserrulae TaxID=701523 RepID=A0A2T6BZL9_9FLAO|nr:hypothetical protein [Kordia periserrulae]PTX61513.1 hypothetical protein C8N46_104156 [Kordia periserrulae]
MSTELIVFIIIVAVLAPLLFINARKNKRRINDRKNRGFMSDYLDKKEKEKK